MTNPEFKDIVIETTLPKPWEQEETFNDVLYDWMSRAPWLGISAAAHLVIYLIVQAIPWSLFHKEPEVIIEASVQAPEEVIEDPPEEEEEEIEEEEVIEEPIIQDFEISDHNETDTDQEFENTDGDPDMFADSPFDDTNFNDVIGIGGGAGGKFGGRFGGKRNLRAAGGAGTEQALKDGLEWLRKHQSEDGYWNSKDFSSDNVDTETGSCECDGEGFANHDVGLTGLALLAFMGDGNTMRRGPYKEVVTKGVKWLRDQQDFETGQIGTRTGHDWIYNHAMATLALTEAYYFDKSPLIKPVAQRAIDFISTARNPYGAWRYDVPPIGDNDTSITGWMVFALKSAEEGGLRVPEDALAGSMTWFNDATDQANGRVGYNDVGTPSSRSPGLNIDYPRDGDESMTAVGLLCRFFLGQNPDDDKVMEQHAELMLKSLPEYYDGDDVRKNTNFMYYWYYGSYAMYQMGGKYWDRWNKAMKEAVLDSQRKDGHFLGSWDPDGPWGHAGGRVYATASMVLCLEVYFRYAKVLGAR